MPAISITFAHFGISAWMRLENSSGVLSIVSKPRDASFWAASGSIRALPISRWSSSMIGCGVWAGTRTPDIVSDS
ncbi:MAG: hypothetical protein WCF39_05670 [Pseudolabrys sp.]